MQLFTFEGEPITGELVDRALKSIFPDLQGFQMGIDIHRFMSLRITGIIFTGHLTNSVVGVAIQKNCNLIIATESNFENGDVLRKYGGILEQCFRHGIYIYSITDTLAVSQSIHAQILKRVFDHSSFLLVQNNEKSPLSLFFDEKVHLKSLVQRFNEGSLYFPFGHSFETTEISITWLVLDCETVEKQHNRPDLIISVRLDPPLLDYCKRNKIPLLWIQRQSWLNEVTREIQYLFSLSVKAVSFYYQVPPYSFSALD